jgi:hypothetical protein
MVNVGQVEREHWELVHSFRFSVDCSNYRMEKTKKPQENWEYPWWVEWEGRRRINFLLQKKMGKF